MDGDWPRERSDPADVRTALVISLVALIVVIVAVALYVARSPALVGSVS